MNKINVTKPSLPPLDDLVSLLNSIWQTKVISNNGPFEKLLEQKLCEYLNVENISIFNNGTSALIAGIRSLDLKGEVITTPYTFVATTHALLWNNLTPKFVDIEDSSFNINPLEIERTVTEKTSAILAVHCYGYPCKVDAIQKIADKYSLKVIYDAAHAFGVVVNSKSILNHGDISILSFHATKTFNTFEGGAVVCKDKQLKIDLDSIKNFGFESEEFIKVLGLNGKMNEFNAAVGLLNLNFYDENRGKREIIYYRYKQFLEKKDGIKILKLEDFSSNYSYFPILIEDNFKLNRNDLHNYLKERNIFTRKYFYPLISNLPMYKSYVRKKTNLKNALNISEKILCLPIYPDMKKEEVDYIISVLINC